MRWRRRRFPITREYVEWREPILVAQEDAVIRAARDAATGREREFVDALRAERERNPLARSPSADRPEKGECGAVESRPVGAGVTLASVAPWSSG
jgi:hypothetical protein